MGVGGLLSFCLKHREKCCDEYDLVEVARERDGIELLVDYYSFQQYILLHFWRGLSVLRQNPFLRIIGAEYSTIDSYVNKLISDLKSLNINLVFYVDGAKGSSRSGFEQKYDTWKKRFYDDIVKYRDLLSVCRGAKNIFNVPESTTARSVLLEIQLFKTLKRCQCEIIQCPTGEADFYIAQALSSRDKAFSVLSNDSDFCIFNGCRFIPQELFALHDNLQLGQPSCLPSKPSHLRVGVISSEKVQFLMEFPDHCQLMELSIVSGNDFTQSFMRKGGQFIKKLDINGPPKIEGIIDWIKRYNCIENHGFLNNTMKRNDKFRQAVLHSRKFYSLTADVMEVPIIKGPVTETLLEGVRRGDFPAVTIAMHYNIYWQRSILEDDTPEFPCVEIALAELRSFIYRIVLAHTDDSVMEYGRDFNNELAQNPVYGADRRFRTPVITYIRKENVGQNLGFFHQVITHLEPYRDMNYFQRYGRKNGFICYILRYFLLLNWKQNLHVTEDEFMALVAMVFGRFNEEKYQSMPLQPTVRCVTIANWFQDVYRHGYLFLGHLLYLSHEFPEPKEIFSSSVWTVLHACNEGEARNQAVCVQGIPEFVFVEPYKEMNDLIREKRHVIEHIVEDVFPFHSQ